MLNQAYKLSLFQFTARLCDEPPLKVIITLLTPALPSAYVAFPLIEYIGGGTITGMHPENSDVLPLASVAVVLIIPLVSPEGNSNGKLKVASPLLLVMTSGTLPNTRGREPC